MSKRSGSFSPSCPVEDRPEWMKAYSKGLCGAMHPLPDPDKEMDSETFIYSMVFFHGWTAGVQSATTRPSSPKSDPESAVEAGDDHS